MTPTEFTTGQIRAIDCFKEGWEIIKPDYWILFAVSLVGILIGGATMYILLGAMLCGIYYSFLKRIDGGRVVFDDLFKGLSRFLPALLVTILIIGPMFFFIAVMYAPMIVMAVMGNRLSDQQALTFIGGALIVELIFAFIMVCFHTLLIFAFPLIIDRQLSAWQAIKTSARAVLKNLGGVIGVILVGFVVVLVGELALCIGVYFAIPILIAGNMVAYRKVFPALNPPLINTPPPPGAF